MRTFRQKLGDYGDLLTDLRVTGDRRRRYLLAYSGHGPQPQHCPYCGQRNDEAHAVDCRRDAEPTVGIICIECLEDVQNGPHGSNCALRCRECGEVAKEDGHRISCSYHPNFNEPSEGGVYL